jgi:hypothetical protein
MKYRKVLTKKLSKYTNEITKYCLSYKYWKKQIKFRPKFIKIFWKLLLHKQCKRLDLFLFNKKTRLENQDLKELCHINIDTLYKICKKLKKVLKRDSMIFYMNMIKNNTYIFLIPSHDTLIYENQ